jgi:DNA-binding Lrp family transcriptional regulator
MNGEYDETDISILRIIRDDCRVSAEDISKEIGVHPNTVHARMKKLTENKIIIGYSTDIDLDRLGYEISALLFAKFKIGTTQVDISDIISIPELEGMGLITGEYHLICLCRAKSIQRFREILAIFGKNPFISQVTDVLLSNSYKYYPDWNPFKSKTPKKLPVKKNAKVKIDDIDNKIIKLLLENATISLKDISTKTDVSISTTKTRIKKLFKNGIIRKCYAEINFQKLGFTEFCFLKLKLNPSLKPNEEDVILKLLQFSDLIGLHSVTGAFDIMGAFYFKDKAHMVEILRKINTMSEFMDGEVNIVYYPIISRFKPIL